MRRRLRDATPARRLQGREASRAPAGRAAGRGRASSRARRHRTRRPRSRSPASAAITPAWYRKIGSRVPSRVAWSEIRTRLALASRGVQGPRVRVCRGDARRGLPDRASELDPKGGVAVVGLEDDLAGIGPLARRELARVKLADRVVVPGGSAAVAGGLLETAELVGVFDQLAADPPARRTRLSPAAGAASRRRRSGAPLRRPRSRRCRPARPRTPGARPRGTGPPSKSRSPTSVWPNALASVPGSAELRGQPHRPERRGAVSVELLEVGQPSVGRRSRLKVQQPLDRRPPRPRSGRSRSDRR